MPTSARVVVLPTEEGPLRVEEVVLPDPGPNQVVVRQHATGICHSQLHQMQRPRTGPVLLGHESTGTVLAKGREVAHVEEGDAVLVTWVPRSGRREGRRAASATLELPDGSVATCQNVFTWADSTIADEQYVVRVPAGGPTDVTAVVGCAVMTGAGAVRRTAGVGSGDGVAVFGVGRVGLSAVAAAKVAGADPIVAVDLREDKLDLARRFGATAAVDASCTDPVAVIHELTARPDAFDYRGQPVVGVDYAFDCIGLGTTMRQIVAAARSGEFGVRRGGTAVLVGVPLTGVELDARDVLVNEKRFVGSLGGSCSPEEDFPEFLAWHREGRLDLDALVTNRYRLEEINAATDALAAGRIVGRAIVEL